MTIPQHDTPIFGRKRRFLVRFSLRTFLIAIAVAALTIGWIARYRAEYEQRWLTGELGIIDDSEPWRDGELDVTWGNRWGEERTSWNEKYKYYRLRLWPNPQGPLLPNASLLWTNKARIERLRSISVEGHSVTDDDISHIVGHRQLMHLNLAGTNVSISMLHTIVERTPRLRWLIVSDDMLTEAERRQLSDKAPRLILHVVPNADVPTTRDEAWAPTWSDPLAPWLRNEFLSHGEYRAEDLDNFVRTIKVGRGHRGENGPVERSWLRQSSWTPDVILCELFRTTAVDADVEALVGISTVAYLGVAETQVTPTAFHAIEKLRGLRVLHVNDTMVRSDTIDVLVRLPHLRWLTIDCATLPFAAAAEVSERLPSVTIRYRLSSFPEKNATLCWDGPTWAAELQGAWKAERNHEFMQAFRVSRGVTLLPETQDTLRYLVHLATLKELTWFAEPPIPFEAASQLKSVEELSLNCKSLPQGDVERLCEALPDMPQLRVFHLSYAVFTDELVAALSRCRSLKKLSFGYCKVPMGEDGLFARLPQLDRLSGSRDLRRSNTQSKFRGVF